MDTDADVVVCIKGHYHRIVNAVVCIGCYLDGGVDISEGGARNQLTAVASKTHPRDIR